MKFPTYPARNLTDVPEKLKPYFFHGVELDYRDKEWAPGTCPFCHKDSLFFVKVETGQFKCQYCNEDSNIYGFLSRLFKQSQEQTTDEVLAPLAENRNVSVESLQVMEVVRSTTTREFIVPGYNNKGVLSNIHKCIPVEISEDQPDGSTIKKIKWRIMGTPGCKVTPLGMTEFRSQPAKNTILVSEGLWDAAALWDALRGHRAVPQSRAKGNPEVGDKREKSLPAKLIKTTDAASSLYSQYGILAVPAAGNFQSEWFEYLEGKDAVLLFDNDHPKLYPADHEKAGEVVMQRGKPVCPGWDGMQRIIKLAQTSAKQPKRLFQIRWDKDKGYNSELPNGYDARDHLTSIHNFDLPGFVIPGLAGLLWGMLEEVKLTSPTKDDDQPKVTIKPIECKSFEELCGYYEKAFHMTQNIRDTLLTMLAVILSTESEPINHLWLRVIGPPGSLKSTLAEAVSVAREYVNPKSVLTGFHSGFLDPHSDKSASLIPQFDRKTAVIKDADTLNNSPHRDQILRELRDLFDGTSRSAYRNRTGDEFEDIRISFILCGTDELRNLNRTFLGERFIDCEIINRGEDTTLYRKRVVDSTYENLHALWEKKSSGVDDNEEPHSPTIIKAVTYGFIKYLKENYLSFTPPRMDEGTKRLFDSMGALVAKIRARTNKQEDITYRPRTELGTRPGAQFTKLSFFLALVLQKEEVDEEIIRVTKKIVHDTCVSFQYDIVKMLGTDGPSDIRVLLSSIPAPETTVRRILSAMREFGILQTRSEPNNSGQRGRDRHVWELTPEMSELYHAVFGEAKPASPAPAAKRKVYRKLSEPVLAVEKQNGSKQLQRVKSGTKPARRNV